MRARFTRAWMEGIADFTRDALLFSDSVLKSRICLFSIIVVNYKKVSGM
jgi:hypothetical protein